MNFTLFEILTIGFESYPGNTTTFHGADMTMGRVLDSISKSDSKQWPRRRMAPTPPQVIVIILEYSPDDRYRSAWEEQFNLDVSAGTFQRENDLVNR